MIIALEPNELAYRIIPEEIQQELRERERNKFYVSKKVPFLRINCLQEVFFDDKTDDKKSNNLRDFRDKLGISNSPDGSLIGSIRGFTFDPLAKHSDTYGKKQIIGKELNTNKNLYINNPRRVPPPQITNFTAKIGKETLGYYTAATLTVTINSKEQFDFLSMFLLHPSNSVFIEFGYADPEKTMNESLFSKTDTDALIKDYVQPYNEKEGNPAPFLDELENKIKRTNGNYEYLIGMIKTYSVSINEELGFDVTIDIISRSRALLTSPPKPTGSGNDETSDDKESSTLSLDVESNLRMYLSSIERGRENRYINRYSGKTDVRGKYLNRKEIDKNSFDHIITVDTSFGFKKYISMDRIIMFLEAFLPESTLNVSETLKSNKYIYSNSPDVLIFKKNHEYPKTIQDEFGGHILSGWERIPYDYVIYYLDYVTALDIKNREERINKKAEEFGNRTGAFIAGTSLGGATSTLGVGFSYGAAWLGRASSQAFQRNITDRSIGDEPNYTIEVFKPIKFDGVQGSRGDLRAIYYDLDLFVNKVIGNNGKVNDILNEILKDIDNATGNVWSLAYYEAVNTDESDKGTTVSIVSENSIDIKKEDLSKTYTFKINQKESVVNSLSFDLSFDGVIGDSIYFQNQGASDSTMESNNINGFLFEKHENGIRINDYIGKSANELQRKLDQVAGGDRNLPDSNQGEINVTNDIIKADGFFNKSYVITERIYNEDVSIPNSPKILKALGAGEAINEAIDIVYSTNTPAENEQLSFNDMAYQQVQQDLSQFAVQDGVLLSEQRIVNNFNKSLEKYGGLLVDPTPEDVLKAIDARSIPLYDSRKQIYLSKMNKEGNLPNKTGDDTKDSGKENTKENQESLINPILQSRISLSMPGIGGIQPLQFFKTNGLPDVYDKRINFLIMDVSHTITPTEWNTTLTATTRVDYD